MVETGHGTERAYGWLPHGRPPVSSHMELCLARGLTD